LPLRWGGIQGPVQALWQFLLCKINAGPFGLINSLNQFTD
jgi:hypothetical protein